MVTVELDNYTQVHKIITGINVTMETCLKLMKTILNKTKEPVQIRHNRCPWLKCALPHAPRQLIP